MNIDSSEALEFQFFKKTRLIALRFFCTKILMIISTRDRDLAAEADGGGSTWPPEKNVLSAVS